jgi:hypothetical protein
MRSMPLYETEKAAENRVHGTAQAETKAAATQNSFAFYKTYLDTNLPLLGDQDSFESGDDGHTCHSGVVHAHGTSVDDAQPQAKGHTAAYNLAVRLANRSNGAPLATIVEQGSYSTLNSHGSLLSMGRFPSIKAAESGSPNRGSRRISRSLDEKALHDIQEDFSREHDASAMAVSCARLNEDRAAADPPSDTATPLESYHLDTQHSLSSYSGDELVDRDDQGVKGFFRGVLQTVRGASRTRSRSSSMIHAPIMEDRGSPLSCYESNTQLQEEDQELAQLPDNDLSTSIPASEGVLISPNPEDQGRNRAIFLHGVNLSTSHEPTFSAPVKYAGTCGMAREERTAQAPTSHSGVFDIPAQYTFDGIPVYRRRPSSVEEAKSASDVFTSQNASFCSTQSTSYSGTVLGVDLDLQHDNSHSIRRSQSPPPPVWFTPQMIELERQASYSGSPESVNSIGSTRPLSRSITSSALTSLLPIAAASGIVWPNYDTPKISFYSPSGNLIQPESSSPPGSSPSEYGGSRTVTTSHYNRHKVHVTGSAGSLPIRLPLAPMTTPPIHKTPLPLHLRHHHNYHQPELSQISSDRTSVTTGKLVKGCDGVVRENSLTPRSGILSPPREGRIQRSTKLAIRDLRMEARFYKSRFLDLAAAHSFRPSLPKGKMLQTQRIHDYNTYAKTPHTVKSQTQKSGHKEDVLVPLSAHALRVCFCRPYDSAGTSTRATTAGACMTGSLSSDGKLDADRDAKDEEHLLPNARVVDSRRHKESVESGSQLRTDSMVSDSPRRASYTGTGTAKRKMG